MAKAKSRAAARKRKGPRAVKATAKSRTRKRAKKAARPKGRAQKAAGSRATRARRAAARKPARKTTRPVVRKVTRKAAPVARKKPTRRPAPRKTAKAAVSRKPVQPRRAPKASAAPVPRSPEPAHVKPPSLERTRRRLPEADDLTLPTPPSSLDLDRTASAARSGQVEIAEMLAEHTETGPEITAGDVDASWESAYSTGDEAPGGDNPTPDQDVVDEIGQSLGLVYEDNEELQGANKITERDKHRWELDPASSEDFDER
jgi:hypothetical protein